MLGQDKLDKLATGLVELAESESDSDAQIGTAMLIVEIRNPGGFTSFYTFCSDKREWIQRAMLEEGREALDFSQVEDNGD